MLLLVVLMQSCGSGSGTSETGKVDAAPLGLDQSDPRAVVETIFAVARGEVEAKVLAQLCDPAGENDNDTRRICDNAAGFDPEGEFGMFFKQGKLVGAPQIEGDLAVVPFLFGPNGDESESMELVRRNGKWYLNAF